MECAAGRGLPARGTRRRPELDARRAGPRTQRLIRRPACGAVRAGLALEGRSEGDLGDRAGAGLGVEGTMTCWPTLRSHQAFSTPENDRWLLKVEQERGGGCRYRGAW